MCNWELGVGKLAEIAVQLGFSVGNVAKLAVQLGIECR